MYYEKFKDKAHLPIIMKIKYSSKYRYKYKNGHADTILQSENSVLYSGSRAKLEENKLMLDYILKTSKALQVLRGLEVTQPKQHKKNKPIKLR